MQSSNDTLAMINDGLASPQRLRHVEGSNDRSAPVIEPEVALKKSAFPELFAEINSGAISHRLKHVDHANDRSAPIIEAHVTIKRDVRPSLFAEIQKRFGFGYTALPTL